MKKLCVIFMVIMIGLSVSLDIVHADGMILPDVLSPSYLAVRYHRVSVSIEDNLAVTRVEQEFYNPNDFPVTGRYLFPVPPGAMLTGFSAEVDGKAQPMIQQDASATNYDLYNMMLQRNDPTLLQYADWESLAFDLTLGAGESRPMKLEYEEVLAPTGGLLHYRYILSTERYSDLPLDEVSITVDLHQDGGIGALYSSSHSIQSLRKSPKDALVVWQENYTRPETDFDLYFSTAEDGFGAGLLAGRTGDQNHLLFLFTPDLRMESQQVIPKDILFIVDRSGSMEGEKIDQARNALHYILAQLNENDRFSIIGFDDQLDFFSHLLEPVDESAITQAGVFVNSLNADGWTDIDGALQAGMEILTNDRRPGASSMILFLTDGLPTAGITDDVLIADRVLNANPDEQVRTHVFGVGYDVNTHLLDRLAADNNGTVTYIEPGQDLNAVLTEFYSKVADPVLTDVQISFDGLQVSDMYPEQIPDMYRGSSLILAARYSDPQDTVQVTIRGQTATGPKEFEYTFSLDQIDDQPFVSRLWATRRVGKLLDIIRVEGENEALVKEVRDLGLAYGLITPYTTFIIEAQTSGPASAGNMALYNNQAELNAASGQTTIQARVQNQSYQQAEQATLAGGANVINNGKSNQVRLQGQNVDLTVLQQVVQQNPSAPFSGEWIQQNVRPDQVIEFGSEEYLELAKDPAVRPYLQGGANVLFVYGGKVISVRDSEKAVETKVMVPENTDDAGLSGLFSLVISLVKQIVVGLISTL